METYAHEAEIYGDYLDRAIQGRKGVRKRMLLCSLRGPRGWQSVVRQSSVTLDGKLCKGWNGWRGS